MAPPHPFRSAKPITSACTGSATESFSLGAPPLVGRVSGPLLAQLADLLEANGSARLRTTPHQKLVILDVAADRVDSLLAALDELGLTTRPSLFRRSTIACTGIEFCKLAIVETKDT